MCILYIYLDVQTSLQGGMVGGIGKIMYSANSAAQIKSWWCVAVFKIAFNKADALSVLS